MDYFPWFSSSTIHWHCSDLSRKSFWKVHETLHSFFLQEMTFLACTTYLICPFFPRVPTCSRYDIAEKLLKWR